MPHTPRRDRIVNQGTITTALGVLFHDIVFVNLALPDMPDASYKIRMGIPAPGITLSSVSNQTPQGFRINLGVTLGGTSLDWAAVEQIG